MDLMNKPSKIYFLHPLRRYVGGKPQIHTIGWFRDHVFWHKNTVIDADNISFCLNEDPGQKGVISDGVEIWMEGCSTPTMSCTSYGKRLHTLATVRRDELCIRYEHGTLNLPDYPFPTVSFTFTRRFLKLLQQFSDLLDHLAEPGCADEIDLTVLAMIAEVRASHEMIRNNNAEDPAFQQIINHMITAPEGDYNVESLARQYGLSRAGFYRSWKKYYGNETPYQFLLRNRLRMAKELLRSTELQIQEIAFRTGFRNPVVFNAAFQQQEKCSPGAYRKKQ